MLQPQQPPTLIQNETPKKLSKREQTNRLVTLIFDGKTNMTENAKTLGIGRATAYRYWNSWIQSEEAQQLDMEWWATFKQLKEQSPIKAFEGLTRLKFRRTPQKIEAHSIEEYSETQKVIHLHMWRPGDEPADNKSSQIPLPPLRKTSQLP